MTVLITLTVYGSDTGPYFNLYSNVDGYTTPFETGVTKLSLIAGYTSSVVPDAATFIRIQSTGVCDNYVDVAVTPISTTTTTSSSSTSTTTSTSSSSTTTTTTPTPTTTTTTTVEPTYAVWWATHNAACGAATGQQLYTAIGFVGSPLAVSYFYNTSDLTPSDYYSPGVGTIGYTDESFGNVKYTADMAIDGAMSSNATCP